MLASRDRGRVRVVCVYVCVCGKISVKPPGSFGPRGGLFNLLKILSLLYLSLITPRGSLFLEAVKIAPPGQAKEILRHVWAASLYDVASIIVVDFPFFQPIAGGLLRSRSSRSVGLSSKCDEICFWIDKFERFRW